MAYEYLKNTQTPRHIAVAYSLLGIKEIPGTKSNPQILAFAADSGFSKIYTNDDTSWCALFVYYVLLKANRKITLDTKDQYDYLRALKYKEIKEFNSVSEAAFGDVLIFQRPGGGHVAFYVGEDKDAYHVLGGNQSNKVSITRIAKSRLVGIKRPKYLNYKPEKVFLQATGSLSNNES